MVQFSRSFPSPSLPATPVRPAARRLRVDRQGLIYDPRGAQRPGIGDRPDIATLLAAIVEDEAELAEPADLDRLRESIAARSIVTGCGAEPADPFEGGRELVEALERRLGPAACLEIDLGIVDIGDGFEPCLAAHLGGSVDELRRLVRRALLPVEVVEG